AVIKNVFTSGFVRVTTLARANVKMLITALSYNLYQLRTIRRKYLG
ncbi:IS5/IS1182 family transposase, partial [Methanococcoides seepicolus]|nr:IS5/IS1182 family transposase [Methanococcoides seepicolus]